MAISYAEVIELKRELEETYADRHAALAKLRHYWHGRYWEQIEGDLSAAAQIFGDLTGDSEVGPDLRVVHNVVQQICVRFQSYLSGLPMIRVYTDPPEAVRESAKERELVRLRKEATQRERVLYGLWNEGNMNAQLTKQGWYLPLMGDCFVGCFPDYDRNIAVPLIRSPEMAYPVRDYDADRLSSVIFSWKMSKSAAERAYPGYDPHADAARVARRPGINWFSNRPDPSMKGTDVEIVEYSSGEEWHRWVGGQHVNGVEHDLGFNIFDQVAFIPVPDEPFNHGAVEQIVGLNELENTLYSLMYQALLENIFPALVLENPMKAPEQIARGAGAVIGLNEGGRAYHLVPPSGVLQSNAALLSYNEQAMKQGGLMPDANFGQMRGSIVTGKAINEQQAAGAGTIVEMVLGSQVGPALAAWNSKALTICRELFEEEDIVLYGSQPRSIADMAPRKHAMVLKGREIKGTTRNEVVFGPVMDPHQKAVMNLQLAGAGLVSKQYQREQVGIPDSEAMEEEIMSEAITDAMLGLVIGTLQQAGLEGADPVAIERNAFAVQQGGMPTMAPPAAAAPSMPGAPSPGSAAGMLAAPGGGPPAPPAAAAGEPSGPQPQAPPSRDEELVTLDEAVQALTQVEVDGRVFLVGEIVSEGETADDIEVAITEPADRQAIVQALPEWRPRLAFKSVADEPREEHVEVTPGSDGTPGGQPVDFAALFGAGA